MLPGTYDRGELRDYVPASAAQRSASGRYFWTCAIPLEYRERQ
jgi:hypothetical protein